MRGGRLDSRTLLLGGLVVAAYPAGVGAQVQVEVHADARSRSGVLSVTDSGLGIADSEMSKLFDRFWRSVVVQERAIQGSGLGLPIVKTIVESHEGHIDVRSEPGTGTTFTVYLPLLKAPVSAR